MLSVKVPIVDADRNNASRECIAKQGIFDASRAIITDCFSGASSLSFYSGRLLDSLGFMGDSECAQ